MPDLWDEPEAMRCPLCGYVVEPGMPYASIPDGVIGGELVELLTCLFCASQEVEA